MATGITGLDQLDAMIAKAKGLNGPEYIQDARKRTDSFLQARVAAGESPDGVKYPPRKKGGRRLVNAGAAITTTIAGRAVVVKLTGVEVFHHYKAGALPEIGGIIPRKFPMKLGQAIRAGLAEVFQKKARQSYARNGS